MPKKQIFTRDDYFKELEQIYKTPEQTATENPIMQRIKNFAQRLKGAGK